MNRQRYTAAVITASAILGLAAGVTLNNNVLRKNFQKREVHEHALFFIEINGTPKDLTAERFQLQDKDVHLENNRSHIVHKHAPGVTWGDFLETENISIQKVENQTCLQMPENRYCGNTTILLNGKHFSENREINQGDNLAIVMGNHTERKAEAYMDLTLPEAYQKRIPGTKI